MALDLLTKYGTVIEQVYEDALVLTPAMTNTTYEGNMNMGAVKIYVSSGVTGTRTSGRTDAVTGGTNLGITVSAPVEEAFRSNELVAAADEHQVPANVEESRARETAYAHGRDYEEVVWGKIMSEGTFSTNVTPLTKDTISTEVLAAKTALDNAGVPKNERYLAVTPEVESLLLQNPLFIRSTVMVDTAITKGIIGEIYGFMVVSSSLLADVAADNTVTGFEFLAWHKMAVASGHEMLSIESVKQSQSPGTIGIQGVSLSFGKVVQASGTYVKAGTIV